MRWKLAFGLLLLAGCSRSSDAASAYQGVIEHEQRALAFVPSGKLLRVTVAEGQVVAPGEALALLDPSIAEFDRAQFAASLDAARARLALLEAGSRDADIRAARAELDAAIASAEFARSELARQRTLESSGATAEMLTEQRTASLERAEGEVVARRARLRVLRDGARSQELDAAAAEVARAEQALHAAEHRLEQHTLRSPIEATILEILRDPGEVVSAVSPTLLLAELDRPYADVFVPEADIGAVRVGQRGEVRTDATDKALHGHVERIAARTEFTPRYLFSDRERPNLVVRVRFAIEDPEHLLRAGVPAFVTLEGQ